MAACAVPHARAPSGAVGVSRLASRRLVASRAGSRRVFLARADAESTRRASAPRRPEGDLEWWTLRARAAAFACVASAVLASGAAAEPAVASREANAVAARRDRARIVDDDAVSFFFDASARDDAAASSSSVGVATEFESEGARGRRYERAFRTSGGNRKRSRRSSNRNVPAEAPKRGGGKLHKTFTGRVRRRGSRVRFRRRGFGFLLRVARQREGTKRRKSGIASGAGGSFDVWTSPRSRI
jgi:hypothetical protein